MPHERDVGNGYSYDRITGKEVYRSEQLELKGGIGTMNYLEIVNNTISDINNKKHNYIRQTFSLSSISSVNIMEYKNVDDTEENIIALVLITNNGKEHTLFSISNFTQSEYTKSNFSAFSSYESAFMFFNKVCDFMLEYLDNRNVTLEYVIGVDEQGTPFYQIINRFVRKQKNFYNNSEELQAERSLLVDSRNF